MADDSVAFPTLTAADMAVMDELGHAAADDRRRVPLPRG